MENTATQPSTRITYLDSIRGIAAMCTLVGHWTHMFNDGRGFDKKTANVIDLFVCGADSVSMFFVLSGLVLAYKYLRHSELRINYSEFLVNRFFRIYPACFVVLVIYFFDAHRHEMGTVWWTQRIWQENFQFWEEASLFRNVSRYFGPVWTLNVEVAVSIIIPFLVLLIRHKPRWFNYLLLISIFWASFYSMFIFHFLMGIWIADNFEAIRNFNFKNSRLYRWRWAIYLSIYALFAMRELADYIPFGPTYAYFAGFIGINWFHYTAVGAALILIKVINSEKLQRWLSARPLLFLGKISYGIYIVHWFFIFHIVQHRHNQVRDAFGLTDMQTHLLGGLFVIVTSILAATLLYYYVEQPFIKFGRKVAAKAAARFA